jgi:UDP-3-O-[3-hydroxymyristoyl] glucosamine N-acyltransferase
VIVYHHCVIGNDCTIHANTVIGSDGFGFSKGENGSFTKISQVGNVVIEDNVEIGANTVIDRATMGSTLIRKGVKLDNLIQVAHNVEIGQNTVVAAQAGIAGSTKIGRNVLIGGQAGFVGHIEVADQVQIQAQSGVAASVTELGEKLYGSPALPYRSYLQSYTIFRELPALLRRIEALEQEITALKETQPH